MLRISTTIILLVTTFTCFAQDSIKSYVQKNSVQLRMEDYDSAWYRDMEAMGAAIGDARVVMLGEQSHGDAATFFVKSKMVRYLHEKKGFNVLAFESDFFALNAGWEQLPKTEQAIDTFLRHNIFTIWTRCHTCSDLFYNYIPSTFRTATPLQVSGFDSQLHGDFSKKKLRPILDSFFQNALLRVPAAAEPAKIIVALIDSIMIRPAGAESRAWALCDSFTKAGNAVLALLRPFYSRDDFCIQVLESIIINTTGLQYYLEGDVAKYYVRDRQMAENFLWLSRVKYPNEKIIIWAHNSHISKNSGDYFNVGTKENRMMGNYLDSSSQLSGKVYILGFTSYEGSTQWTTTKLYNQVVQKPLKNCFENWIDPGYGYAFTDFKTFRQLNPYSSELFYMKGSTLGNHRNQLARWTDIFDGVFFVRKMYGCE